MSKTIYFTTTGHGTVFNQRMMGRKVQTYLGTSHPSQLPILINGTHGVMEYNSDIKGSINQIAKDLRFAYLKAIEDEDLNMPVIHGPIVVHMDIRLSTFINLEIVHDAA